MLFRSVDISIMIDFIISSASSFLVGLTGIRTIGRRITTTTITIIRPCMITTIIRQRITAVTAPWDILSTMDGATWSWVMTPARH